MKLFEYAVILHNNVADAKKSKGAVATLIVKPTTVLAKDQAQAMLLAGRAIPAEYLDRLDQVEVACRPF